MPFYKRFLSLLLALTVMLPLAAVAEDAAPPSPWTVTLDEILGVIPFQEGFLVAYTQHLEYCCPEAQTVQRIPLEKGEQVYLMAYDAPNQRALLYLSQAGQEACQAVWMQFENGLFSRANAYSEERNGSVLRGIWANGSMIVTRNFDARFLSADQETQQRNENWFEFNTAEETSFVTLAEAHPVAVLGILDSGELMAVRSTESGWALLSISASGETVQGRSLGNYDRDWITYNPQTDEVIMLREDEEHHSHLIRSMPDGSEDDCGWLLLSYQWAGKRGFCANGKWVAAASLHEIVFQRFDSPFVLP